ncbi:RHO1 GDP-GTP exchange protein 1/2, partial [Lecanoromycetidae sp. Uapishka_2]
MAYQQGGRRQANQYSQYQGSPTSQSPYASPANASVRRTPSFDPGDDSQYPEDMNGERERNRGYRPGSIAGMQHEELYMGGVQSPGFPPRSTSYGTSGGGGYQHQESAPAPPPRSSYNPQQYGVPQTQYSPQPQSATSSTFNAAAHQPPVGSHTNSRNENSLPPTPGTPGPTPPAHSPQRMNTLGQHPQARPLPGPPAHATAEIDYFSGSNGHSDEQDDREPGYDDLMQEVEAAVMGRPPPSRRSLRTARTGDNASIDETYATQSPLAGESLSRDGSGNDHSRTNGHIAQIAEGQYVDYDAYSDRSDAEAEAGLAAMHMADEQDAAEEARRRSGRDSLQARYQGGEYSSDSDVHVDMDTYGGGFPGNMHYGERESSIPGAQGYANDLDDQGRPFAATRSSQHSDMSATLYEYPIPGQEYIHPFAPARVDRSGTGGLSEPGTTTLPRRLSFEDGDEVTLAESEGAYTSGTQSPSRDSMQDIFFHPGMGPSRPLPAAPVESLNAQTVPQLMPAGTYQHSQRLLQYDQYGRPRFPAAPDAYDQLLTPQGTPVPRSSSLISHSSTPQTVPPIRSKTDADRVRILKQQQMAGLRGAGSVYGTDSFGEPSLNPSSELVGLLPEIPSGKRRKFNPSKLSTTDFKKCAEPWALSSIVDWIKEMSEGEADLKESAIVEGIVALFTHKVPTMNTADAEVLGAKVAEQMFDCGTLLKEEEWVKFGKSPMSGVLYQLTGTGCYSPMVHTQTMAGRCYAPQCMRTLKKINLQTQVLEPQRKVQDWMTFWKMTKESIGTMDKKEVERQNNLHEIVTSEDVYMDQLNVLRILYRDELAKWQPPIISPRRMEKFIQDVFGKVDTIKKINEDYLLAALKYRQNEQGPWISGFSDIFREWIRKAKTAYIDYAVSYPHADYTIRQEDGRNMLFRQFLQQARENERSKRLGWDTYLKAPITRLQRYSLLLTTVLRHTTQESEEKTKLEAAIEEIKEVTLECDARVADMTKGVMLAELQGKLQMRPTMADVQLNLTHMGREIIHQGVVERRGTAKFSWVETQAILFDHYLVLAKIITARDAAGGLKYEKYDVSKVPIPMDLLVLESDNDDAVVKSTMKGLGSVTTVTTKAAAPTESRASRQSMSNPGTGPAKTRHAASLYKQNAEPFRLRVVADTAFGYDAMSGQGKTIVIPGTPLYRATQDMKKTFGDVHKPNPVCRATVNCATSFNQPFGNPKVAVGTDYGVYVSDYDNPRGWTKAISAARVTQIAVLEEFSLFLLIADKSLIAYHLDTVCPVSGGPTPNNTSDSSRRAPQKLSGARDVGFFATGRMKDRTLVFYKKREGVSSIFKVLEPVYQKSSTSNSTRNRFGMKKGTVEFFRDFDDFYIPSECYAINLFHSSLAISTARGIEVLTLDKKLPMSIPDLKAPDVASIAQRINGQRPLGMFRLSDAEFLLAFESTGVFCNKHGDVSRSVVCDFIGKARQACLIAGTFLILIGDGGAYVEVRNAISGRLRQVISGRDVRLLDEGVNGGRVKICMQHPEENKAQIIVEMIVNEGLKE